MTREQCPVCSASDLEELIALEDYPYAGNGVVQADKLKEVPTGTLLIGTCSVCGALFQLEPVSFDELDNMLLRHPPPFPSSETRTKLAETERFLGSLRRYGASRGRILIIGCGTGAMMERLKPLGYEVVGVDAHPVAVEIAKKAGFDVTLGRFDADMFEDNSFDMIIARSILEHVREPSTIISTMDILLRPGGMIAVEVPNTGRIIRRSAFGGFAFNNVCYWTTLTLRYTLTLQGLDVLGGYDESHIAMFARKVQKGEPEIEPEAPLDERVEEMFEDLDEFLDRKERMAEELPELIRKRFPGGVVVFGAGNPTVDMLYYTGMKNEIRKIVSTDKTRHGAVLAGSSFKIEPLEKIGSKGFDAILVSSSRRQDQLVQKLSDYRKKGGHVIRFTPEIEVI